MINTLFTPTQRHRVSLSVTTKLIHSVRHPQPSHDLHRQREKSHRREKSNSRATTFKPPDISATMWWLASGVVDDEWANREILKNVDNFPHSYLFSPQIHSLSRTPTSRLCSTFFSAAYIYFFFCFFGWLTFRPSSLPPTPHSIHKKGRRRIFYSQITLQPSLASVLILDWCCVRFGWAESRRFKGMNHNLLNKKEEEEKKVEEWGKVSVESGWSEKFFSLLLWCLYILHTHFVRPKPISLLFASRDDYVKGTFWALWVGGMWCLVVGSGAQ